MRIAALFMCLVSVSLAGCVGRMMTGTDMVEMMMEKWEYDRKKQDEIQIVAISTKPNGDTIKVEYTFRKSGKSLVHLSESESRSGGAETLELPAGIHEACLARLQDAEFFKLETNEPRWVPFAKSQKPVSSIEIHFRDQKHVVKEYANLEAAEGYTKFKRFLDDVRRHPAARPLVDGFTTGFHNRTSDQLGGVITGLSSAEPQSNRIEIVATDRFNNSRHYKWTLEKNGTSHGWILYDLFCNTYTELELPSTAFDEFLAMIEKTQFFQMKSASAPSVPSEIPLRIIRVRFAGKEHVVTQKGEVEIDPGFNKMWALIREIENRSVQVAPGSRRRVVTGLSPAGPPLP